jgi:[amino group carrier protein]-lysine/ornithine hydrolase
MDRLAATELIRGLVAIPSLSREEADASHWLVEQMRRAGFERATVDDAGNAVGEIGPPHAPRTLMLLGHIDTVPGNIPVRIEASTDGDLLYGRGSVDAKGPLATFVAAAARVGAAWAHAHGLRLIVAGAVEEEAATSKGARFIASRFDGSNEPIPTACVIGEPSHWHRITLGYKGRLLLDLQARQAMAHTAGPDASVAAVVVDIWNWVTAHAAGINSGRTKAFDQLSPSLRRFITATGDDMVDTVDGQIAWRIPLGVDMHALVRDLAAWTAAHLGANLPPFTVDQAIAGHPIDFAGARTSLSMRFRGAEMPWRSDRQNALVRSLLHAIRHVDAGVQPGFLVKTGTSDMNVVGPLWQCPIVAYGPGDSALDHTPHEHLPLDEYWRAILVLEHAIRTFGEATKVA